MWLFKKKEFILSRKKYIEYLPVGTIIKIYNDDNQYMIYRYLGNVCRSFKSDFSLLENSRVYDRNNKNVYYYVDYGVIPYPAGDLSSAQYIMHDDIEEIIYLGYSDDYRESILNNIDKWNQKKVSK